MSETFKVELVVDTDVGKTSILKRLTKGVFGGSQATIAANMVSKTIVLPHSNVSIKLQVWDTAG